MTKHCKFCQDVETVFETANVVAIMASEPAVAGHVLVYPKKHFTIFEQVPDEIVDEMFLVANKISAAQFEGLGLGGTNIVMANGVEAGQEVPHVSLNVIPRKEEDELNFEWQPKQLSNEEMNDAENKLKEGMQIDISELSIENSKQSLSDPENYMIKQLDRLP